MLPIPPGPFAFDPSQVASVAAEPGKAQNIQCAFVGIYNRSHIQVETVVFVGDHFPILINS